MEERIPNASDLNLVIRQALLTAGAGIGLLAILALLTSAQPSGIAPPLTLGVMSTVAFLVAGLLALRTRWSPSPARAARRTVSTEDSCDECDQLPNAVWTHGLLPA